MRQSRVLAGIVALALAGCSEGESGHSADRMVADMAVSPTAEAPAIMNTDNGSTAANPIAISLPRIAYVYDFGYRLPAEAIAPLQMRHADLCEAQGPETCRILDMRQSGMEGEYAQGSLSLSVAASEARVFGVKLAELADGAGGSQISSAISGEDLSKRIVDTEARLRARIVLRDRLMDVLASRQGSVAELVEAERGVAQVNEEIDQAQSWLAEMKGRVEFSRVNISYTSGAPSSGGFLSPIREALANIGSILGITLAVVITALTVLLPLGLIGWLVWLGARTVRRRHRSDAVVHDDVPPVSD
ncbi:DUF4349 domain-containing protein [Croceicoccus sp. Ery15]|uniref:DUF4349 domain-containing protein n=1 Tax=Croceicoccus sp. Ery15 TaxID=1703338 RepID=UPI001E54E73F|nr:DUF4349 domain-containing protein [Croceicoccus sp. Ery15]